MVIIVSLIVNFLIFFHEIATPLWLFSKTFKWCETQKDCNRLRLIDILVRPMQRLTKYSLLLKVKFRWYYKIIQIIYTNLNTAKLLYIANVSNISIIYHLLQAILKKTEDEEQRRILISMVSLSHGLFCWDYANVLNFYWHSSIFSAFHGVLIFKCKIFLLLSKRDY